MVLLGLVRGVLFAVIVASQGCGQNHPRKRTFHGSAPPRRVAAAPAAPTTRVVAVTRPLDPQGPFFGFRHGPMTRRDAPRGGRVVALTFDDGPGPQTAELLAELKRLHARATFFVVGSMAAIRPQVVRAEKRAGMQIGNHTWSHAPLPTLPARAQGVVVRGTKPIPRLLWGV